MLKITNVLLYSCSPSLSLPYGKDRVRLARLQKIASFRPTHTLPTVGKGRHYIKGEGKRFVTHYLYNYKLGADHKYTKAYKNNQTTSTKCQ